MNNVLKPPPIWEDGFTHYLLFMDQPTQVAGQDQTKNRTTDNDENPGWTDSHKR